MPVRLKEFLQRWAICTVAVLVAAHVVSGIRYDQWTDLLVATLLLGLLNSFVRPWLLALSLPLLVFTLGLFTLVINAGLLLLVGTLVKGFHVEGFGPAFWAGLIISVITILLNTLTGAGQARFVFRRGPPPRRPPGDDNSGPIIDV